MTSRDDNYKIAVQMLIHEGNLVWNRFSVYLVANSIVMAALVLLITNNKAPEWLWLSKRFSVVGICLCILWFILTMHGFLRCSDYRSKVGEDGVLTPKGQGKLPPIVALLTIVLFSIIYAVVLFHPSAVLFSYGVPQKGQEIGSTMSLKTVCALLVMAGTFLLSRSLFKHAFRRTLLNIKYPDLAWYLRMPVWVFGYKKKYETMKLWKLDEVLIPTSPADFPWDMKFRILEPFIGFVSIVLGTIGALFI